MLSRLRRDYAIRGASSVSPLCTWFSRETLRNDVKLTNYFVRMSQTSRMTAITDPSIWTSPVQIDTLCGIIFHVDERCVSISTPHQKMTRLSVTTTGPLSSLHPKHCCFGTRSIGRSTRQANEHLALRPKQTGNDGPIFSRDRENFSGRCNQPPPSSPSIRERCLTPLSRF